MFFKKTTILFFILISAFIYSQNKKNEKKIVKKLKTIEITEENFQHFIKQKPYVLIYFYSKKNKDSLKMKKLLEKIEIKTKPIFLSVNIDTNLGLRKTFSIKELPTIVILKKKKLIYGLTGYIDNIKVLTNFLDRGIKLNDYE